MRLESFMKHAQNVNKINFKVSAIKLSFVIPMMFQPTYPH